MNGENTLFAGLPTVSPPTVTADPAAPPGLRGLAKRESARIKTRARLFYFVSSYSSLSCVTSMNSPGSTGFPATVMEKWR